MIDSGKEPTNQISNQISKLETDEDILQRKVDSAIQKYGVHCVVGNILETRYSRVTVSEKGQTTVLERPDGDDIESILIPYLVQSHRTHISKAPTI